MKNTKGLSGVITTLIIILLVIAAIGIIWAVVNPFIKGSGDDIASQTDCMALDIRINRAVCNATGDACSITLKRGSGGKEITGVKLLFYNELGTESYAYDFVTTDFSENSLATTTATTINPNTGKNGMLENATTLSIVPYFTDGSGNPAYCSETGSYNVVNA